ncbi:unnamed protein product [Calypogeia fissa]
MPNRSLTSLNRNLSSQQPNLSFGISPPLPLCNGNGGSLETLKLSLSLVGESSRRLSAASNCKLAKGNSCVQEERIHSSPACHHQSSESPYDQHG